MNAVEIKNLTKKFGEKTAVNNISLEIRDGELFGQLFFCGELAPGTVFAGLDGIQNIILDLYIFRGVFIDFAHIRHFHFSLLHMHGWNQCQLS